MPTAAAKRLRNSFRSLREPLRPEDLAQLWISRNADALLAVALRSLREPAGTRYTLAPLTLVVFETDQARTTYQDRLFGEAKRRNPRHTAQEIVCLHAARLTTWCRQQVLAAFTRLAVDGVFR